MRVGFFTEVYHPVVNGIVASVDALAAGLRRLGHDVYCFTPHVPGYEERDGPVYRIPSLPLPVQAPYRLTVPVVSRRNRRAVINRLHIVHAHSPFVTGWMAVRYARRLRLPLVYTYHTQLEEYAHYVPFESNATKFAAVTLTRNFANQADTVIVPTGVMGDRLRELGVTAPVEVIPSGIDLEYYAAGRRNEELRSALGVQNGERMLFFVSRLAREKNAAVLIDALARCTVPARLVIAGDGPERQALEERAAQAGVADRTVFLGAVDRDGLPNLYASADAFVFPSVTETQGLVLAEALAAGCYVIAANAQQNREVLAGAGTLVDATPGAFAAAIEASPFPAPAAVSMLARSAAAAFGIDRTVGRILTVYEGLHARRADAGIH